MNPRVRAVRKVVHKVWITLGLTFFVVFTAWSLIAYRSSSEARRAATADPQVDVGKAAGVWHFRSALTTSDTTASLVFFPGALVDPRAYAPIARAAAARGHPAFIVELPRRGAFGGADDSELGMRLDRVLRDQQTSRPWVAAGHSRGGVVVSNLALRAPAGLAGIVLIGTSHPRDIDLSSITIPTTKIVGTKDGLASRAEVEQNRERLPPTTRWIWIEGGNHSQFGWYGFQPGDRPAAISAAEQRTIMINAILDALRAASSKPPADSVSRIPDQGLDP
ncbi:MAG: alpha/beta family hydrolase [Gemmatimonadota bacterium]